MLTPHEIENAFRASCRQPEAIGVEEEVNVFSATLLQAPLCFDTGIPPCQVTTLGPGEFIEAIMRCAKAKYREEIATNRQRFAHMLHKYHYPTLRNMICCFCCVVEWQQTKLESRSLLCCACCSGR